MFCFYLKVLISHTHTDTRTPVTNVVYFGRRQSEEKRKEILQRTRQSIRIGNTQFLFALTNCVALLLNVNAREKTHAHTHEI